MRFVFYFDSTASQFPSISLKRKIGPVVRQEIYSASAKRANERFGLNPERPLILVTGGGQGAVGLNQAIFPLIKHWLVDFQVVHLTGTKWKNSFEQEFSAFSHPDYHQIETIHEGMGDLLSRSEISVDTRRNGDSPVNLLFYKKILFSFHFREHIRKIML